MPARCAIARAERPTISALTPPVRGSCIARWSFARDSPVTNTAPLVGSSRRTAASTGRSHTIEFSAEQRTPWSNALPLTTSRTAFGTSAVRSMTAGTFPGPTP